MTAVEVPVLHRAAVEAELKRLSGRSGALLAIYGTGERLTVSSQERGPVPIIPVRSELELRAELPDLEDEAPRVYLVPWRENLPDDIAGRFVSNGRVYRIDKGAQLAAFLGASKTDDGVSDLELAAFLLRSEHAKHYRLATQVVTKKGLYELWLREQWKVPTEGGLGSDALLGWAALNGQWVQYTEVLGSAKGPLESELLSFLSEVDAFAPVTWNAWKVGKGLQLLSFAILCEALAAEGDPAVQMWLKTKARQVSGLDVKADVLAYCAHLSKLVRPALAWLKNHDAPQCTRALAAAGELVDDAQVAPFLEASTRLPQAWLLRLETLGDAFLQVSLTPKREHLQAAEDAWCSLERHEDFLRADKAEEIERVEMALRLATWLVVYHEQPVEAPLSSHEDAERLGQWYVKDGGYIDWARRRARALHTGAIAVGVSAVVAAADRLRQALDERFASALADWITAGRPSKNIVPIDAALKRVAVRFLEQDADRRLLVLLMDGMAWAQAVQLLQSLGRDGRRWGTLAWHAHAANRVGESPTPAMFAALPTVTEYSRAAFFAGALPKDGEKLDTSKDVERFAANKALHSFVPGDLKPKLLLRGDGHTADGSLSKEAQGLIASTEQRVVAMVINAIDASLKSDSQQEQRWGIEAFRSLPQILDAAMQAGRHVLLAADHGHVPADRLSNLGPGDGGGARYRLWRGEQDALQPGERLFKGEGVYLPRGAQGLVLLENDAVRYGGAPHAGEHGGASLAEVVAPCVLVGFDDEVRAAQDPALQVRSFYVPEWWTRALPTSVVGALSHSEPAPRKKPKKSNDNQVALPGFAAPAAQETAPTRPSEPAKPGDLLPQLANSEMLKARSSDASLRTKTVAAVHFLLLRSCAAPSAAFASHLGEPEFRIAGLISKLQEVLNLDGYEILRFDRTHRQVFLDKEKLEQQFQVKL